MHDEALTAAEVKIAGVLRKYARKEGLVTADIGDLLEVVGDTLNAEERVPTQVWMTSCLALMEIVRRAKSVAAVAREAYILGAKAAHEDTVEGRYKCEPGDDWDCDPRILEDAKANAGVNDGSR